MSACILRIGIFFDGTGNSMKGAKSNVAKLYGQYKQGEDIHIGAQKYKVFKKYIVGIGGEEGFFSRKINKGYGGGGGKKIAEAIAWVTTVLKANPKGSAEGQVRKREIDVFGFSRGAAEARDFINTFYREVTNGANRNYKDVRFHFIGLYDTVASFGEPGNNINMKPKTEYAKDEKIVIPAVTPGVPPKVYTKSGISETDGAISIDLAKMEADTKGNEHTDDPRYEPYNFNLSSSQALRIVHMTAHDEKRINFPLSDTYSSGAVEYELIGVHSDVGGGYKAQETENFSTDTLYYKERSRALYKAKEEAIKRNTDMGGFGLLGNYYAPDTEEVRVAQRFPHPHTVTMYKPVLRKKTTDDLSIISLHLMYKEAKKASVPLDKPDRDVPQYLQSYYEYAKIAKDKAWTYTANEEGDDIKEALSHHSAVGSDNYTGNTSLGDILFDDSPDVLGGNDVNPSGREIYTNNPNGAVSPR